MDDFIGRDDRLERVYGCLIGDFYLNKEDTLFLIIQSGVFYLGTNLKDLNQVNYWTAHYVFDICTNTDIHSLVYLNMDCNLYLEYNL